MDLNMFTPLVSKISPEESCSMTQEARKTPTWTSVFVKLRQYITLNINL
jgi:hypothetical protein